MVSAHAWLPTRVVSSSPVAAPLVARVWRYSPPPTRYYNLIIGVHLLYMIPHSRKFPLRTEFLRFRSRAKRTVAPLFIIYYLLSAKQASRLATIIPKKVNKLATTRNYLKRLVYDTLWPQIKDQKMDVVVVFKPMPLKKSTPTKQLLLTDLHV